MPLAAILPASTSASTFALLNSTASSASLLVLLIASFAFSLKSAVRASVWVFASSANFLTVSFMVFIPLVARAAGFGAAFAGLEAMVFAAAFLGATFLAAGFAAFRSEEHTSELQSLMRSSYAVFCLNKNTANDI